MVHQRRNSVPLGVGMKIHFCLADVTILVVNGVDAYYTHTHTHTCVYIYIYSRFRGILGKFEKRECS